MDCNGAQEAGLTCGPTTGSDTIKTWSPNENSPTGTVVAGPSSNTYTSTVLSYPANGTIMYSQNISAPVVGHVYYGGCLFYSEAGFTAADGRFEWYYTDGGGNNLVFANRVSSTNGQWTLMSARVVASTHSSETGWRIRNFIVNGTSTCYSCKHIIIDLTEAFGPGNEPTKEWCDKAVREWRTFDGFNIEAPNLTKENATAYVSAGSAGTTICYNYEENDSPIEVREPVFYRSITEAQASSVNEYFAYLNGNEVTRPTLADGHYMYVTFTDYFKTRKEWEIQSRNDHDIYCPEAEPVLGSAIKINDPSKYAVGGACRGHGRMSAYNNNRGFNQTEAQLRLDFNFKNPPKESQWRFYNLFWADITEGCTLFQKYNARFGGGMLTPTAINKDWCDYWINGKSVPLIHIGDHRTIVGYNDDYTLVCNDIELHPEIDGVYIDDAGVIQCAAVTLEGEG